MQLRQSIEGVMDILSEANVAQDLSDIIEAYLLAQDRRTMKDCVPSHSPYKNVASAVDNLGWDCFVEGRIPQVLIVIGHGIGEKYIPIMAHLAKARRWSKRCQTCLSSPDLTDTHNE